MELKVTIESFRCMACGKEFKEHVERGEDKERACPECRSNSVRHLRGHGSPAKE